MIPTFRGSMFFFILEVVSLCPIWIQNCCLIDLYQSIPTLKIKLTKRNYALLLKTSHLGYDDNPTSVYRFQCH